MVKASLRIPILCRAISAAKYAPSFLPLLPGIVGESAIISIKSSKLLADSISSEVTGFGLGVGIANSWKRVLFSYG